MNGAAWAVWSLMTVILNASLTLQSRAKNSDSLIFNGVASFITGLLYVGSLIGVGKSIFDAHSVSAVAFAVTLYAAASSVGSVLGQYAVLKLPFLRKLEHR
jgi:hypothetical protein